MILHLIFMDMLLSWWMILPLQLTVSATVYTCTCTCNYIQTMHHIQILVYITYWYMFTWSCLWAPISEHPLVSPYFHNYFLLSLHGCMIIVIGGTCTYGYFICTCIWNKSLLYMGSRASEKNISISMYYIFLFHWLVCLMTDGIRHYQKLWFPGKVEFSVVPVGLFFSFSSSIF